MNLKLSDWAAIAEIVSGAAIVVTIIVLIVELRGNSALLERQIELDRIDRISIIQESPELAAVLAKIAESYEPGPAHHLFMEEFDLTYIEADRFLRFARAQWQGFEADFLYGETSRLDSLIPTLFSQKAVQLFWEQTGGGYHPDFIKYVNSLVTQNLDQD